MRPTPSSLLVAAAFLFGIAPAAAQLSGTYAIPGDFVTLSAAAEALGAQGVSGPVVFELQSGTYTDRAEILAYPGASPTSGVTIRPTKGADVTFAPTASTPADDFVIHLNGADYVTIKGVRFEPGGATLERSILLTNGNREVVILGNQFVANGSSKAIEYDYSENRAAVAENIFITGNTISGFENGVWIGDPKNNSVYPVGLTVSGNTIDVIRNSVYVRGGRGVRVRDNTVRSSGASAMFLKLIDQLVVDGNSVTFARNSGIYVDQYIGEVDVSRNVTVAAQYGIRVDDGFSNRPVRVISNVSVGTDAPLSLTNVGVVRTWHNTLYRNGDGSGSALVQILGSFTTIDLSNNVLYSETSVSTVTSGRSGLTGDWNVVYAPGLTQTPQSLGTHSFVADPLFVDPEAGDFTPTGAALDATGAPVLATIDVNGADRAGLTPVDLGAVAFISASTDGDSEAGAAFALGEPFPNPAPAGTALTYDVPAPADVTVDVVDLLGRRVLVLASGPHAPDRYRVGVAAGTLAPGVYVVRMRAGAFAASAKLTVVR